MWDSVYDAQRNGPLGGLHPPAQPEDHGQAEQLPEETMKKVAARYQKEAETINASRTNNLTDSTVVYVLSESFSDPSRVPGLKTNKDSMPNIPQDQGGHHLRPDALLRLRRRYGQSRIHGTFRPEHGQFRVLPVQPVPAAGPEPALDSHHQPAVGRARQPRSATTRTNPACTRATNYKKFGFSHFYTLTGPDVIKLSGQDRRVAVRL